jgi:hypothetical protein
MQDFQVLIGTIVAALTIMFFLWSKGKGAQQAAALKPEDDEVSPLKDFSKKRACPRPAGLETDTAKQRAFKDTPLQDIAIDDVPGVGKITKERLKNHDYISITTGEQLFGFFLYKTRPGSSAPRKGRCDEFKTWLTNDCLVQGKVADAILEACMQKAEKVCIYAAGREYGRVSGSGSGSQSTTQVYNNKAIQDVAILEVPGVGPVTAELLKKQKQITNGEQLFGFFLYVGRDEERFKSWLKDECKVRGQEANRIYEALANTADVICAFG